MPPSAELFSDIGHFHVFDITEVLAEAFDLVENGVLNEDQFRHFAFANAVRFWRSSNPEFFKVPRSKTRPQKCLQPEINQAIRVGKVVKPRGPCCCV